jgi:hypothetical protein
MDTAILKYNNINSSGIFNLQRLFSARSQTGRGSDLSTRNAGSSAKSPGVTNNTESTNDLLASATVSDFEFSIDVYRSSVEQLTANSYYRSEDSGVHLSLAYTFSRTIQSDGLTQMKQFQLTVDIDARNSTQSSANAFNHKEDLMKFVRRVVDNIYDTSQDEHKLLVGVVFDLDDLGEIAGVERGKLLNLLNDFVRMVAMLARLRQINKGIDSLDPVVIHPEREKSSGVTASQGSQQTMNIQFSFQELTASTSAVAREKTSTHSPDATE